MTGGGSTLEEDVSNGRLQLESAPLPCSGTSFVEATELIVAAAAIVSVMFGKARGSTACTLARSDGPKVVEVDCWLGIV